MPPHRGRIRRIRITAGSAREPEDQSHAPEGIGVWAAQFGSGQHRFWFTPLSPSKPEALYDRVAGILLRELGNDVMLSALWMYPDEMLEPGDGRPSDRCAFMFHIVPRERHLSDELVEAEYRRLSTSVVGVSRQDRRALASARSRRRQCSPRRTRDRGYSVANISQRQGPSFHSSNRADTSRCMAATSSRSITSPSRSARARFRSLAVAVGVSTSSTRTS